MPYLFTPAAQRVLEEARRWHSDSGGGDINLPVLLLALLSESECRAAAMLRACGITSDAIQSRWKGLQRVEHAVAINVRRPDELTSAAGQFGPTLRQVLRAVESGLVDSPHSPTIATEHLLLGVAAMEQQGEGWLARQGLTVEQIAGEIGRLYGLEDGTGVPIELSEDDPAETATEPDIHGAQNRAVALEVNQPEINTKVEPATGALRVVDASANRAREAFRVLEDFARFVLDDRFLSGQLKHLRHELAAALAIVPPRDLYTARDTQADVGTTITAEAEAVRSDLGEVAIANFKRLTEALRSLEEYGKLLSPELGRRLKQLRYASYTLERALAITRESRRRLEHAQLYVLLDGAGSAAEFEQLAGSLIFAGVDILQLRDKSLPDRDLIERARLLTRLAGKSRTLVIFNDRPDLARLAGADGVHVGQDELTVKDARAVFGTRGLVGVSTHSIEQARAAVLDGANYIGVGPTFPSATKQFTRFTGVDLLRQVAGEISLPAFAIGGITLENLPQVLAAGSRRVAVSSAIVEADEPAKAAGEFLARLRATD